MPSREADMVLLLSGMLFVGGIFALVVGNWVAVLICLGLSYTIFLPAFYIWLRNKLVFIES